ncbi:MAG: hypothetical protein RIQ93_210 [Verrucomicrobiota bacterium]|jgi:hypothetical protein
MVEFILRGLELIGPCDRQQECRRTLLELSDDVPHVLQRQAVFERRQGLALPFLPSFDQVVEGWLQQAPGQGKFGVPTKAEPGPVGLMALRT